MLCDLRGGRGQAAGVGPPGAEEMGCQDRDDPGPGHVPCGASVFLWGSRVCLVWERCEGWEFQLLIFSCPRISCAFPSAYY